jgi:hypothetical protein
MPSVIEFDSSTPEQELAKGAAEKFDYAQVESALRTDRTVAENVYSRCAKHHLKQRLGDKVRLSILAEPLVCPIWVAGASVTLFSDGKLDTPKLEELTEGLATAILKIQGQLDNIQVWPLDTKIAEVSAKAFTFSLKLKWGIRCPATIQESP